MLNTFSSSAVLQTRLARVASKWVHWIAVETTTTCLTFVLGAFGLCAVSDVFGSQPLSIDMDASVLYHDNVGFAQQSSDKVDDFIASLGANIFYDLHESESSTLTLGGHLRYEAFAELDDLNQFLPGASLTYRGALGATFDAPWYEISLGTNAVATQDSDLRDGYEVALDVKLGKVFGEKFGAFVGYRHYLRRSTDSNIDPKDDPLNQADTVFDLNRQEATLHLEYAPTLRSLIYGEYAYRTGDSHTTGSPANFNFGRRFPLARDTAFGPNAIVWRVESHTHIGVMGFRQQIADALNLDVSARYVSARVKFDNDYEAVLVNADMNYQF